MKKIINSVEQVENEMVLGMAKAYPQYVRKLDCGNVVVRAHKKEGKVALISGGGSAMSRLTADMWERECWMRLSPALFSLHRRQTRFLRESRLSLRTRACLW